MDVEQSTPEEPQAESQTGKRSEFGNIGPGQPGRAFDSVLDNGCWVSTGFKFRVRHGHDFLRRDIAVVSIPVHVTEVFGHEGSIAG